MHLEVTKLKTVKNMNTYIPISFFHFSSLGNYTVSILISGKSVLEELII